MFKILKRNKNFLDEELNNQSIVNITLNLVSYLNQLDKNYKLYLEKEKEDKSFEETEKIDIFQKENQNIPIFQEPNIEIQSPPSPPNFILPTINNNIFPAIPEPQGDKTPPTISLNGNQVIELILGKSYTELGATARDDIDGDLTDKIQIISNVDTGKIGNYQVSYEVSDLAGNKTKKIRVVKVVSADQIPPVITLNGDESIELKAGEKYIELGATALDETDGDLTSQIKIESNIDLSHTGIYQVKYSVSDSAGNITEKIRVVKITEGNSSVGLPQTHTKSVGKSGKKSKRRTKSGKILYSCKDTRALNFSNVGIHKEELCIWKKKDKEEKKREKEMETDFASQNPSKEKVDLASPNQPSMEEKNNQKQEKEKKEKQKILLTSTCLNIQSTEKVLKKWSKDKENIKKLQTFLKKYNYLNGRIDGAFGAITHSALQNFQQDNKLYSDGIFGKGTAKWIDKNCRYIKKKEIEKETIKNKKEDFAPQNPPQPKPQNLEKKEKVILKEIKKIKKELEGKKEKSWIEKIFKNNDTELEKFILMSSDELNRKNDEYINKMNLILKNAIKKEENFLNGKNFFEKWYANHIKWCWFNCDTRLEARKKIIESEKRLVRYKKKKKQEQKRIWKKNTLKQNYLNERNNNLNYQNSKKETTNLWNYIYVTGGEIMNTKKKVYRFNFIPYYNIQNKIDPNKELYILVHGIRSNSEAWARGMSNEIHKIKPNAQIMALDWREMLTEKDDGMVPDQMATWISPTEKEARRVLKKYGLNANQTTFIAHSLGTLLSATISKNLKIPVKQIIALDPAHRIPFYLIDIKTKERFKTFENKSQFSRCFVGRNSLYGSETLAETCDEKFLVDFHNRLSNGEEHSVVIQKYRDILNGEYFGKNKYLNINNKNNYFEIFKDFNGIIDVRKTKTKKEELNYLKIITRKNKNFFTFVGTKKNNLFVCKENKSCIFEGYKGNDIFYQSKKNIYITDFNEKNDKIILRDKNVEVQDRSGIVYLSSDRGNVYIYGEDKGEVEEWIKILNGELPENYKDEYTIYDLPRLKKENPIQIE